MGVVYKAEDSCIAPSPLKFLPENCARLSGTGALSSRGQAASALNHPNICTIHEIGEEDGRAIHRHGISGRADAEALISGKPVETDDSARFGHRGRRCARRGPR